MHNSRATIERTARERVAQAARVGFGPTRDRYRGDPCDQPRSRARDAECFVESQGQLTHLVLARPHQGIIAQVAADVGGDNLTVDAIARNEVLVLAGTSASDISRHCGQCVKGLRRRPSGGQRERRAKTGGQGGRGAVRAHATTTAKPTLKRGEEDGEEKREERNGDGRESWR
jgi:hypothetical protein